VCVSNGNDGTCGTAAGGGSGAAGSLGATGSTGGGGLTGYVAPRAALRGLRTGQRFRAGRGPRTLAGHVDVGSSPLLAVKLRLTRRAGDACSYFSGTNEDWHRTARCGAGFFFKTGESSPDFSYLLPGRLPVGLYTLEAAATATDHVRDVTRVTFRVG
jgi:hypothetical protein